MGAGRQLAIVAATIAIAAPPARASDLENLSLEELLDIKVASPSKEDTSVADAAAVVSVVTDDTARRYGWFSINDILYRQPGFAPSRDYERRVVSARGQLESWNNNHLLLLIDGVPFNDDLYGTAYTWEITPLGIAQAVEIMRSPASALYGGNATNGVINLRTPAIAPDESYVRGQIRIGPDGSSAHRVMAAAGGHVVSTLLSYDHVTTPGEEYESPDGSGRTDAGGGLASFRIHDGRTASYLFAKLDGRDRLDGLSLQVHHQAWQFETGHGWLWQIPDLGESMKEERTLIALAYRHPWGASRTETVVRYQRHDLDWNTRYFPASTTYPGGATEVLVTHTQDLFVRAQLDAVVARGLHVLGGVEYTGFLYTGDDVHVANFDPDDGFAANPDGALARIGPFLEWVAHKPVHDVAAYVQLTSGSLLGDRITATTGVRYDRMFFHYVDITDPARPERDKAFQELSPRLGIVARPIDGLRVKLLAGQGFRTPSPSELFGANTLALASNLADLRAETIRTVELAADWKIQDGLTWRADFFHRSFDNQIAYSVARANLSTNVYSSRVAGVETELLGEVALGDDRLQGFANYAYVRLLDETVEDPTITKEDRLTWVSPHVANLGANWIGGALEASGQVHVQGAVARRDSDRVDPIFRTYRDGGVSAWATVDARVGYRVSDWAVVAVVGTNLGGARAALIKNHDYPFDYRSDGRRLLLTLDVH